jgi:hypothetical protein
MGGNVMTYIRLFLLTGLLAAFFPYNGTVSDKEQSKDARKDDRRVKVVYLILSTVGLFLGVLHQLEVYPVIAGWSDRAMDSIFHMLGGVSE